MKKLGVKRSRQRNRVKLKYRKEGLLSGKSSNMAQFPADPPQEREAVIYHKNGKLMTIGNPNAVILKIDTRPTLSRKRRV